MITKYDIEQVKPQIEFLSTHYGDKDSYIEIIEKKLPDKTVYQGILWNKNKESEGYTGIYIYPEIAGKLWYITHDYISGSEDYTDFIDSNKFKTTIEDWLEMLEDSYSRL